jgi:hypothetical protein
VNMLITDIDEFNSLEELEREKVVKQTFDFDGYHNKMRKNISAQDIKFAEDLAERKLQKTNKNKISKSSMDEESDSAESSNQQNGSEEDMESPEQSKYQRRLSSAKELAKKRQKKQSDKALKSLTKVKGKKL